MPPRQTLPGILVLAASMLQLAGCGGLATEGRELWPYDYTESPPALAERLGTVEGPNGSYFFRTEGDGEPAFFIGNRNRRSVTVFYESANGSRQQVIVPPGDTVAVGYPVARIVDARAE